MLTKMEDKKSKDHVLETLISVFPTQNKIANFFVDVIYNYYVDSQVIHDNILHNDDN